MTTANTIPALDVPGITREEAARLYYMLHRGQLHAWHRSGDLRHSPDRGAAAAAFNAASDAQEAALDAADITTMLGRAPGEEALSFAMRAGADANSAIRATERV